MLFDYDTQFYSYFISLNCKILGSHNEHKRDGILYIAFLLVFLTDCVFCPDDCRLWAETCRCWITVVLDWPLNVVFWIYEPQVDEFCEDAYEVRNNCLALTLAICDLWLLVWTMKALRLQIGLKLI